MKKKTQGLTFRFAIVFTIFSVCMLILTGFLTYVNQAKTYKNQCLEKARALDSYLANLMQADSHDAVHYIDYYMDNYRDIKMKWDFDEYQTAFENFNNLFNEKYPGKTLGVDIQVEDLSDDVQKAYFEYDHQYWVLTFESARDAFGMSYTYFLVMEDERSRTEDFDKKYGEGNYDTEHTALFLIDGERTEVTEKNENGEEVGTGYLWLGDTYYNAVDKEHEVEWETWNTGKTLDRYQEWNNEWGHTYAYYKPLIINGRKLGLIVTEIDVDTINKDILRSTLIQTSGIAGILLVLVILVLLAIDKLYISKIEALEHNVNEYTANKNAGIAEKIRQGIKGKNEIASLSEKTAYMITELDTYMNNLKSVTAEQERIGSELKVATHIQAEMLPTNFPDHKDFSIYASMDPAKEVGGDFYDFFMIDEDHLGLVIADVSGKGIPAALFMAISKMLLNLRSLAYGTPADFLSDVNRILCENNGGNLFVTVWLGVLTLSTGNLICANAGHEYPVLKRNGKNFTLLVSDHCPPLAAMEDLQFENRTIQLQAGDELFLYTDGVTEAKSVSGERFGMDRMIETLNNNKELSPKKLLKKIKQEIDTFTGGCDPFDDITMLGLRYNRDPDKL